MEGRPRHIVIVASRRSGTTVFWELFRQLPAYRCLDEPFNPVLRKLPKENIAGTRRELIELFLAQPARFRSVFSPIPPGEETTVGMTAEQRLYFEWLLSFGPVVTDLTRCPGKIADVKAAAPDAVFVHLYRSPVAFVTSHLVPSGRRDPLGLRAAYRRRRFFTTTGNFNKWGMEDLLRGPHAPNTRRLLEDAGVEGLPDGATAVSLLLRYWLGAFRIAEREGRRLYGGRFVSLSFEDFCATPQPHLASLLALADHPPHSLDVAAVRRPRPGYQHHHPRWHELAAAAGFTPLEISRFFAGEQGPRRAVEFPLRRPEMGISSEPA